MTHSAAIKNLYDHSPETVREIRTVELFHPDIGTHRFCEPYRDKQLTLDAGAPRDASATVTFTAVSLKVTLPNEGKNKSPATSATFAGAGQIISELMDQIVDVLTPVEFIVRQYVSTDLTEPAVTPVTSHVKTISINGQKKVTISAMLENGGVYETGDIYTLENFPTLAKL